MNRTPGARARSIPLRIREAGSVRVHVWPATRRHRHGLDDIGALPSGIARRPEIRTNQQSDPERKRGHKAMVVLRRTSAATGTA